MVEGYVGKRSVNIRPSVVGSPGLGVFPYQMSGGRGNQKSMETQGEHGKMGRTWKHGKNVEHRENMETRGKHGDTGGTWKDGNNIDNAEWYAI